MTRTFHFSFFNGNIIKNEILSKKQVRKITEFQGTRKKLSILLLATTTTFASKQTAFSLLTLTCKLTKFPNLLKCSLSLLMLLSSGGTFLNSSFVFSFPNCTFFWKPGLFVLLKFCLQQIKNQARNP